jgi:mono/diheme cytochrome c family protein
MSERAGDIVARPGVIRTMTRLLLSYLIVTLLLASFLATAFVGIMLAFVIPEQEHVLWGVGHRSWTYVHLYAALAFSAFIIAHVVLHSRWLDNTSSRFLPRSALAWSALVLLLATGAVYTGLVTARRTSMSVIQMTFGRQVYFVHNCDSCHSIGGVGGVIGPDLTHLGSIRTRAWLKVQVTDPAVHRRRSRMPRYVMPARQLDALTRYLSSLK